MNKHPSLSFPPQLTPVLASSERANELVRLFRPDDAFCGEPGEPHWRKRQKEAFQALSYEMAGYFVDETARATSFQTGWNNIFSDNPVEVEQRASSTSSHPPRIDVCNTLKTLVIEVKKEELGSSDPFAQAVGYLLGDLQGGTTLPKEKERQF